MLNPTCGKRRLLALAEPREDAHRLRLAPDRIPRVDDEPALPGGLDPVLGALERRFGNADHSSQPS